MTRRVVITRPTGPFAGSQRLTRQLVQRGYHVFELHLLRCSILPLSPGDRESLGAVMADWPGGWIAFLSPTAVFVWRELLNRGDVSPDLMRGLRIAAQGSGTADACQECFGKNPDFIPGVFLAEEFAKEFAAGLKRGERVIVPQSADGRDVFAPTLRLLGMHVLTFSTYRLEPQPISKEELGSYRKFVCHDTAVVFMSPSAVQAAAKAFGGSLGTDKVVSIGPITSQALRTAGFSVWREAHEHSEAGVIASLEQL